MNLRSVELASLGHSSARDVRRSPPGQQAGLQVSTGSRKPHYLVENALTCRRRQAAWHTRMGTSPERPAQVAAWGPVAGGARHLGQAPGCWCGALSQIAYNSYKVWVRTTWCNAPRKREGPAALQAGPGARRGGEGERSRLRLGHCTSKPQQL